ncbi:hypothetical protein GCM10023107_68620 [Actinoplanes octamycinicus]
MGALLDDDLAVPQWLAAGVDHGGQHLAGTMPHQPDLSSSKLPAKAPQLTTAYGVVLEVDDLILTAQMLSP